MDRNIGVIQIMLNNGTSLSARRAWIEIKLEKPDAIKPLVALRKESVDRNLGLGNFMPVVISRSPQGERG